MAAPSPEKRELQLVEKVEFRILAIANKERELQELLQRYLCPLILKVASDHASVRTRVSVQPVTGAHHSSTLLINRPQVIEVLVRLKTFIQPPA